jgi:hypothetical protein
MGTWGNKPWDNDAAANWFSDMISETGLAERVEKTLQLDVKEHYEEVRAAAALVVLLGHTYVWPIEDLDRHLELAASRLEEILAKDLFDGEEEFTRPIQEEIKVLRSRLGGGVQAAKPDQVKWWHF